MLTKLSHCRILYSYLCCVDFGTGFCDTSRESLEWILTKQGTGNAAIIVVGGVEEALEAKPGTYNIVLAKRKGFVKIAIQTGCVRIMSP